MIIKKITRAKGLWAVFVSFLMLIGGISSLGVGLGEDAFALESSSVEMAVETNAEENSNRTNDTDASNDSGNTNQNTTSQTPNDTDNSNDATAAVNQATTSAEVRKEMTGNTCKDSLGALGWVVCPLMEKVSEAVDWLYEKIEGILLLDPIPAEDGSPIYEIWKYCLGVTNVVFIIFLLVVIYSQITGWGISNYGLKKTLPKLIVMAIMVNLSFLICSLAVDVSNVIGHGLRGVFEAVENTVLANMGNAANETATTSVSMASVYSSMAGGLSLAIGGGMIAFGLGEIWMLIPTALGAIVAVVTGLITIALRQAVVMLLVMIAPLAFVANIMPNTEGLFKKWKQLLTSMLVFYPMFSLLFGAASLAGFAVIMSAKDGFGVLLGLAVQIFPLIFSWKMMQMSGTFLGNINAKIRGLADKPLAANRAWADSHRQLSRQRRMESGVMPSARLMRFLSDRKIAREEEISEMANAAKLRGQAYAVKRNYKKDGTPTREGEEAYARQAQSLRYKREIEWHKDNMNKGLGQLETVKANATEAQKVRLKQLDLENMNAADELKMELARGEKIEFENAKGFYNRMENAMNVHFDDLHGDEEKYKMHTMNGGDSREAARERYSAIQKTMENDIQGIHYATASATQAYDTQKKVIETKMNKYFDFTAPTRDVEYRLSELTKGEDAVSNVDSIIAGLRVLNQRGDTDLVKKQMENLLEHNVQLGTHASQALASFLMFEVKDSDPWLRRFGKYINLETARAFNANERKAMNVTYDEYIKGYHDGEPVTSENPTGRMYAKKGMRQLVEGTSLDNIERVALDNLDESLKKAYGYDSNDKTKAWDIAGWMKKREEIQTAFEPAFLSASLKWLSGSEQINSGVKFWTGYELKQKKDEDGKIIVDENGDPEYNLVPTWEGKEFRGHEKDVEEYFRRKTNDYFKDQTTGQILGMRTDYRDPTMEHLLQSYLEDKTDELSPDEKRKQYEDARAEIQTRYSNETPEKAMDLRKKDLKKLKMDLAGRQLRKILGSTGKLEQIYRTRRSGAANNAKDWLRGWVGLDNEEAMYKEVKYYEKQRKKNQKDFASSNTDDNSGRTHRAYDESARSGFRDNLDKMWEDNRDASGDQFYDIASDAIKSWFGEGETIIGRKFREYYERKAKSGTVDAYDLKTFLDDLLHDPDNYPDA